MVRHLKRILIGTTFTLTLSLSSPAVFADSVHGKSADAPGQNKPTSSQTSVPSEVPAFDHSTGNVGTSGIYDESQPYSTADQNNTGANDTSNSNQYASTRDGSPSLNGNGGGLATGKPCAGCVGKADNKNPKGQYPNGSDANKGYECDGNHGIGRSNPAHTGCTTVTSPCTTNCGGHGGGCTTDCGNTSACTTDCLVGGRGGGGMVLAAETTAAFVGASNELPNTGTHENTNWWTVAALLSFLFAMVYWRQVIAPLTPTEL